MSTEAPFTISADGSRCRTLIKPIEAHGDRQIALIRLRPPKYRDIMKYGDPAALIVFNNGSVLPHEDMGIIENYISALASDDQGEAIDPALLQQVHYVDALALRDAVLSFFKTAASKTSSAPPTS